MRVQRSIQRAQRGDASCRGVGPPSRSRGGLQCQAALEGLSLLTPNGTYAYSKTDHSGLKPDYISINTVKGGAFVPTDWAKTQLTSLK